MTAPNLSTTVSLRTTTSATIGKQEERMSEAITTMQRIFQGGLLKDCCADV